MFYLFFAIFINLISCTLPVQANNTYCFNVISPNDNTPKEIEDKINQLLSKMDDEDYFIDIDKHQESLHIELYLKMDISKGYKEIRNLLNQIYPNISFIFLKFSNFNQNLSFEELKYYNFVLFKVKNYPNNTKLFEDSLKQNLALSNYEYLYDPQEDSYHYFIKINNFSLENAQDLSFYDLIEYEYKYYKDAYDIYLLYIYNHKKEFNLELYTHSGEKALNIFSEKKRNLQNAGLISKKDAIFIKNLAKQFNGDRHLIHHLYNTYKNNLSIAHVRALREHFMEKNDKDIQKTLKILLQDILINSPSMPYEELEFSLNILHELLACSQFLSERWNDIFFINKERGQYYFNYLFIKNCLEQTLKIPVKTYCEVMLNEENLILLLNKRGSYHIAPLIRIVNQNKIYWVLMETIAQSDAWFLNSNFEDFFICLKKMIENEQKTYPEKEVKGYLNRVNLQKSNYLCEVFAYANSLAVLNNLDQFTTFLDEHTTKENIVELYSLPYFIIKYYQGTSNLDLITHNKETKMVLERMMLIHKDNDEAKEKKINAAILLQSFNIMNKVISQIEYNLTQPYYTDCMMYYGDSDTCFP